jgi:hypothetical protein
MENTVRIPLTNGRVAFVYREVLHKTYRQHEDILRRAMTATGDTTIKMSQVEDGKKMPKVDYVLDVSKLDMHEINELYILNQVAEWTYGPVTHEVVEAQLTRDDCIILIREMDRLYQPLPLASKGKGTLNIVRRFFGRS